MLIVCIRVSTATGGLKVAGRQKISTDYAFVTQKGRHERKARSITSG